jgi:peptide chain release factor subunit 1
MALRNDITKDKLQQLAQLHADGPVVLSAYLDLDPERFATPPARATEITSLIDSGGREFEAAQLDHGEREQVRADLQRLETYLRGGGGAPSGAHALAVFCCASLDMFEALSLPVSVQTSICLNTTPYIVPLVEIGPPEHWCVALVNRRATRILRGSESQMVQVAAVGDKVRGHPQGGWSAARSVEHDVEAHLRHTSEVLLSQFRRRPFTGLLVAAPQELHSTFEGNLHSYVRERLAGYLDDIDVETATEEQVRQSAAVVIAGQERKHLEQMLERLRAEIGRDGRAAAGAQPVMQALQERRVEALMFTHPQRRDDALEHAIEAAIAQDAEVLAVDGPELGPLGGIAALLRF